MNSTTTIGLDLGDRYSHLCVLDQAGEVEERARIATTRRGLTQRFARCAAARVVLEAGCHSRWASELLNQLGHEVIVANARQLPLIYASGRKDDVSDPEKLARLGRADVTLLKPIMHRGRTAQNDLSVIKARDALVRARTGLINAVRGMVKSSGERIPSCASSSFAKKARDAVPAGLVPALGPLIAMIGEHSKQIREYDKAIEELAKTAYPETEVLRQVDGAGPITALAFVLTLEDPSRFARSRNVGPYLGLCPRRHQSGDTDRQCRISKAGDTYLRKLLVQCAHHVLGPFGKDSDLRTWGLRLAERGGTSAKKRAAVAVARKLAVLLHRLWTTGEQYQPTGYAS
jgi:transposase